MGISSTKVQTEDIVEAGVKPCSARRIHRVDFMHGNVHIVAALLLDQLEDLSELQGVLSIIDL